MVNRSYVNKYGIDDERIYNLKDIINNFSNYFGFSFEELNNIFANYEILTYDAIGKYIRDYKNKMFEFKFDRNIDVSEILKKRKVDYDFFKKTLAILSAKGLRYLELLEYMGNMNSDIDRVDEFESVIEELGIFHYGSILKGIDINRLLSKINNIINLFDDNLDKINSLSTYDSQNIDNFALIMGGDGLYPLESLVAKDNYISDKTSFNLVEIGCYNRKRRELVKYN